MPVVDKAKAWAIWLKEARIIIERDPVSVSRVCAPGLDFVLSRVPGRLHFCWCARPGRAEKPVGEWGYVDEPAADVIRKSLSHRFDGVRLTPT